MRLVGDRLGRDVRERAQRAGGATMMGRLRDFVFAALATVALGVAGYLSTQSAIAFAQVFSEPPAPANLPALIKFAVEQGGALAVLLVVLFFYRRDYRYLSEYRENQFREMLDLVKQNTAAQTDTAAAIRENAVVVHQAKNVIQQHLPSRRSEDDSRR